MLYIMTRFLRFISLIQSYVLNGDYFNYRGIIIWNMFVFRGRDTWVVLKK